MTPFGAIPRVDVRLAAARLPMPRRSCNRHDDCDAAEAAKGFRFRFTASGLVDNRPPAPANFHCHDDDCEDCFG